MKIIIGVDGREQQRDAIALGRLLARGDDDEVILAHVFPLDWVMPAIGPLYENAMREDAQALVDEAGSTVRRPYGSRVVGDTSPVRGLHRLARAEHADVLVLASSHHGPIGRVVPGGVGELAVHGAPCAVAVAPRGFADHDAGLERIGVAFDGSPESRVALEWAQRLARRAHADLTLYRVIESHYVPAYPGLAAFADAIAEERRDREETLQHAVAGVPKEFHPRGEVLDGSADDALAAAAIDEDLVVTGSRGYGTIGTVLLGSVSRGLLHHATKPVVILPRTAVGQPETESQTAAADVTGVSA